MSLVSTLNQTSTNLPLKPIQSGPYTKAHFQSTVEGARNVKNVEEIEHLLRDYPAALDLYRTGKYKVKVKCEIDVERVILVEKRSSKNKSEHLNHKQNSPTNEKTLEDDQQPIESQQNNETLVNTASSSFRTSSNAQPKVEQQRAPSKERLPSLTATTPTVQKPTATSDNTNVVHDTPKNPTIEYSNRPLYPYWSNQIYQKASGPSPYVSSLTVATAAQPNPYFQRTKIPSLNQAPTSALGLPIQSRPLNNTQVLSTSRNSVNVNLPPVPPARSAQPTHQSITANQMPVSMTPLHFQSQMTLPRKVPWAGIYQNQARPYMYNHPAMPIVPGQTARNRARSVDPTARRPGSVVSNQMLMNPNTMGFYWNRPDVSAMSTSLVIDAKAADKSKEQVSTLNNGQPEKLSIRQLQDTFQQMNSAGRLPMQILPELLKRFGIFVNIQELTKAAQELQYNYNESVSARRLVHMLVKLGRIAKSTSTAGPRQNENQEGVDPSS